MLMVGGMTPPPTFYIFSLYSEYFSYASVLEKNFFSALMSINIRNELHKNKYTEQKNHTPNNDTKIY